MDIKLNSKINIDLSRLIESKLLIQANSGGGKSWLIRRLLEQSAGKVQQIVLDPEGEFGTLREKYDYILAGKGGDTPAEPKSAALLARKLLELNVSAIIDLYELHPQDRKKFVRIFLDAMVNAPKELWHECLVVVDEAHIFVPEKGESEAANAVIGLMSLGRKRGFCGVLATQRISKLHKDAAAECNNKLIGRSSLDIDRKRAAEELGISSKEEILALRTLKPGEFFAFGPAISDEVIKVEVGPVETAHPKIGVRGATKMVPPTDRIKKILGSLADLPAEAEREAQTISELNQKVRELSRELVIAKRVNPDAPKPVIKVIEKPVVGKRALESLKKSEASFRKFVKMMKDEMKGMTTTSDMIAMSVDKLSEMIAKVGQNRTVESINFGSKSFKPSEIKIQSSLQDGFKNAQNLSMGAGEQKVLIAVAQHEEGGVTREQLTVLTGYKRSTRDAYLQRLQIKGYVRAAMGRLFVTNEGIVALGSDYKPLPTGQELRDYWVANIPTGEKRILEILIESYPDGVVREVLSNTTGYQRSSRDAYIQRLTARELVEQVGPGIVRAKPILFE